jgi:hypothetical protein
MKTRWLCFGCLWLLAAIPCAAADVGTVTLLDGKPRLLRGTAWFNLVEGVRIRDSDVIDVPEKAQFQLEMIDGGALSLIGPGALYVVSLSPADAKQRPVADFWLSKGWLKFDTKPTATRLRLRSGLGSVLTSDAAAVIRLTGDTLDVFVETGTAKIVVPGGAESGGTDVKGGGFATRAAGKPVVASERAPSAFVSALPRDFMDALPLRAARFANAREPVPERDATYPEVQSWLSGPYRVAFMKRFEPKLADPAFKATAEANAKVTPEWAAAKPAPAPAPTPAPAAKVEPPKEEKKAEPERTWRWPWERAGGK